MRLALVMLLAGCRGPDDSPGPGPEKCTNGSDDDGDGYVDCADAECASECVEICENGFDDDDDGKIDCLDASCGWMCPEDCVNGEDDDGDWIIDCADEECASTCDGDGDGFDGLQVGGDDCEDTDDTVYPGAVEIYYDDADNDCDPATLDDDQDADGFAVDVDCNDTNANTYAGAPEVCGDGELNDCDAAGYPPESTCYGVRSLGTADYRYLGVEVEGAAGSSLAGLGDTEGDGYNDLIIGAFQLGELDAGGAYVVHGPLAERTVDLRPGACELTGAAEGDWAGSWVGVVGDLNDDQRPDAAVGARYQNVPPYDNNGKIFILVEPCTSGTIGNQVGVIGEEHDEMGTTFTGGADLTGDAQDDLVAGTPLRNTTGIADQGAVIVFAGPILLSASTPDAVSILYGISVNGLAGSAVAIPGDVDGDGKADLLTSAPFADAPGDSSGEAYLFTEILAGNSFMDDATVRISIGDEGDHLGRALGKVGDISNDGQADLAIGAPDTETGTVYLVDQASPLSVVATLVGDSVGDAFGTSITGLRDMNGDSVADVAVGAPWVDANGTDSGAVYLYFGPLSGTLTASAADVALLGESAFDYAGSSVASAGDMDLDGDEDLLIGAPFHDSYGAGSGIAYLVTFGW